jgi:two-component system response regulator PilR (NtrC family)
LSATHKNLENLVADGEFREDLYYRINVIELNVPPLRERGRDMLLLATEILRRLAAELGVPTPGLTAAAEAALTTYRFPGNVRELENILERAMTLASGEEIDVADIQLRQDAQDTPVADDDEVQPGPADDAPLGTQLEEIERDAIVKALEQTKYNKTAAARLLGISFRALRYRVKKLGID